jgi:hypothetical protein
VHIADPSVCSQLVLLCAGVACRFVQSELDAANDVSTQRQENVTDLEAKVSCVFKSVSDTLLF